MRESGWVFFFFLYLINDMCVCVYDAPCVGDVEARGRLHAADVLRDVEAVERLAGELLACAVVVVGGGVSEVVCEREDHRGKRGGGEGW